MGLYSYSMKPEKDALVGVAQVHDADVSYKDLTQVCGAIKGKQVEEAEKVLNDAIALKKAIPYRKFNTGMGHRSNLGGRKGRYPKKECRVVLALLKNAVANAVNKGAEKKNLFVKHAGGYKQNTFKRYRRQWVGGAVLGYGKQAIWSDYVTAWAELMVAERKGKEKKEEKQEQKNAAPTPKKEPAHKKPGEKEAKEPAHNKPEAVVPKKPEKKEAEKTVEKKEAS